MLTMRQIFKERSPLRSRLYSSFLLGKKSKGELKRPGFPGGSYL